ncbi:hypothetical protein [Candidatus Aquiluna sp. UB-MaderosW2red]|uniref:hypothetical protein n=1 Tax=Candidatus Aquiluna sp. UB-MaderosW2red TaxID=1855377 RepID=UPI000875E9F1|nr:hypothetical protein [Candidatus Aquiluna sp. UB-MaderosW2red]SCX09220.1 hypothetical protein SAMN05216534_0898 [Candidatus Aquiluna sp. UB-MaderosW2red]
MRSDKGTIAPYIAGLLALMLFTILGSVTVGTSLIAANRIQAVADAAIVYGHDRAHKKGIPNESKLRVEIAIFMQAAPSAKRLTALSYRAEITGEYSNLEVCARFVNPIGIGVNSGLICRSSKAKSFLIP